MESKKDQLITIRFSCVKEEKHSPLMEKKQEKLDSLSKRELSEKKTTQPNFFKENLIPNKTFNLKERIYGIGPDSEKKYGNEQKKAIPIEPSIKKFSAKELDKLVEEYDQLVKDKIAEFKKLQKNQKTRPK